MNMASAVDSEVARAVREGLSASMKTLPPFLLYDERGSQLFERITTLPEYYVTRAERAICETQGPSIAECALALTRRKLDVLELGAGTAKKSQILLHALAAQQGSTLYVPADVAHEPLLEATCRLQQEEDAVDPRPLLASHELALRSAQDLAGPLFVWFLGSSIGNYEDVEAVRLLRAVRAVLGGRGLMLLGTDLEKPPEILVPAYDDAQGVTAAFNKNLLVRINRELGGHFDLETFRHVAVWNARASCMEMHLESACDQSVTIEALEMRVTFHAGERIHTESSHKYDDARLARLFESSGLVCERSFFDGGHNVAVHLMRVA